MNLITSELPPPLVKTSKNPHDQEKLQVDRLIQKILGTDISLDPITIINLYVSLKSKPLAILVGTRNSGKVDFIKTFASHILHDSSSLQHQFMLGHPWWAEQSANIASFSHMHTQFNAEKLKLLIETAWQQENEKNLFIAGLCKISPAEVGEFFSELSRQLQVSRMIYLPEAITLMPFYFPHNLLVTGSMDATIFDLYNENLLLQTSIIHWREKNNFPITLSNGIRDITTSSLESEFLCSRIRNEGTAHMKIQQILGDQAQALKPILEIESILMKHNVEFSSRQVTSESIIYLANAWSSWDNGLFNSSHSRNLQIALDLVITQIILPRAWGSLKKSPMLRSALKTFLGNEYPYSIEFLEL